MTGLPVVATLVPDQRGLAASVDRGLGPLDGSWTAGPCRPRPAGRCRMSAPVPACGARRRTPAAGGRVRRPHAAPGGGGAAGVRVARSATRRCSPSTTCSGATCSARARSRSCCACPTSPTCWSTVRTTCGSTAGRGLERVSVTFPDDAAVRRLAQRLAASAGTPARRRDPARRRTPPDGTRFHAVLAPVARSGTVLSLRVPRGRVWTLPELVAAGALPPDGAFLLEEVVDSRCAFLVTGGTGTGKTSVLSALLSLVDPGERIVLVEDASELRPEHPHVVALEGRPPNIEGAGEISLQTLVRQALRMRPDRLVVGEVRGAEVVDLLAALNTGHGGGCGTLHANSAADVPARIEALSLAAGLPGRPRTASSPRRSTSSSTSAAAATVGAGCSSSAVPERDDAGLVVAAHRGDLRARPGRPRSGRRGARRTAGVGGVVSAWVAACCSAAAIAVLVPAPAPGRARRGSAAVPAPPVAGPGWRDADATPPTRLPCWRCATCSRPSSRPVGRPTSRSPRPAERWPPLLRSSRPCASEPTFLTRCDAWPPSATVPADLRWVAGAWQVAQRLRARPGGGAGAHRRRPAGPSPHPPPRRLGARLGAGDRAPGRLPSARRAR